MREEMLVKISNGNLFPVAVFKFIEPEIPEEKKFVLESYKDLLNDCLSENVDQYFDQIQTAVKELLSLAEYFDKPDWPELYDIGEKLELLIADYNFCIQ
jgi:hypothetical protein